MIKALVYALTSKRMLGPDASGAHGSVRSGGAGPTVGYETSGSNIDAGTNGLSVDPSRLSGVHERTGENPVDVVGVSSGGSAALRPN